MPVGEHDARPREQVTGADVRARFPHEFAGAAAAFDGHRAVADAGVLHRDHAVRAGRDRRTGHHLHRRALRQRCAARRPRGDDTGQRQGDRSDQHRFGTHRVPVHRGVAEDRQIDRRADVFGQLPAQRPRYRDGLDRARGQRPQQLFDAVAVVVDGPGRDAGGPRVHASQPNARSGRFSASVAMRRSVRRSPCAGRPLTIDPRSR